MVNRKSKKLLQIIKKIFFNIVTDTLVQEVSEENVNIILKND